MVQTAHSWVKWDQDNAPSLNDALAVLDLDYKIELRRLNDSTTGRAVPMNGVFGRWKSGRDAFFETVRDRYVPISNDQLFGQLQPLVSDGSIAIRSGGMFRNGGVAFLVTEVTGLNDLHVPKTDERIRPFTLTAANHMGRAAKWKAIPTNPRCWNQIGGLLRNMADTQGFDISIRHRGEVADKLAALTGILNHLRDYFVDAATRMKFLASKKISASNVEKVLDLIRPIPDAKNDNRKLKAQDERGKILASFDNEQNTRKGLKGTWWAMTNAVTEYLTHERAVKKAERTSDRATIKRLEDLWFGPSMRLMNKYYKFVDQAA